MVNSSLLLIIALMLIVGTATETCSAESQFTIEDAVKAIHQTIFPNGRQARMAQPLCSQYTCCNISSSNQCLLKDLTNPEFTLILPGGKTQCIFQDSSPFAFQFFPGAIDQILFYFQGGGACFNKFSTDTDLCTPDAVPQAPVGIFERQNPLNRFQNYTMYVGSSFSR